MNCLMVFMEERVRCVVSGLSSLCLLFEGICLSAFGCI